MARSHSSGAALLLTEFLLIGSILGGLQSCADAKAVAPDPSVIDQVRLGFGLDRDGRVSSGCAASTFSLHDPIRLSLRVKEAAVGSVIRVSVRNVATHGIAWSEARPVTQGPSVLTFEIGRELAVGRYRAESTLGGAPTNLRDFVVHARREGVR